MRLLLGFFVLMRADRRLHRAAAARRQRHVRPRRRLRLRRLLGPPQPAEPGAAESHGDPLKRGPAPAGPGVPGPRAPPGGGAARISGAPRGVRSARRKPLPESSLL